MVETFNRDRDLLALSNTDKIELLLEFTVSPKAKEKLSLFKTGRLKLEASIKKDTGNTEFNFLRLIIQEHAPRVVEYRHNLENDIAAIRSNFKTLPQVVQQAIQDYIKKSKVLNKL